MQMSWTGLIVTIAAITVTLYDAVTVVIGIIKGKPTSATVSTYLIKAGIKAPAVSCGIGYVCGHLFGYMYPEACPPPSANILAPNFWMGMTGLTVVAYAILWRSRGNSQIRPPTQN